MGSKKSAREEVGCGRNKDVQIDRWRLTKLDRKRNKKIRDTTKGEISKKVQESRIKWYGHVMRMEGCVG